MSFVAFNEFFSTYVNDAITSYSFDTPTVMTITKDELTRDLDKLRHGGEESLQLFLDLAGKFYLKGGHDYLESWVMVALHELSEAERNTAMIMLLKQFLGEDDVVPEVNIEQHTLH